MPYINQFEYYHNNGEAPQELNWGSYQYVPLSQLVKNFMMNFVGPTKDVNHADRFEVRYHLKQAIKELNMDAVKEVCIAEIATSDDLTIVLPHDYVNWVRISLYEDGVLRPLEENLNTNYAKAHLQDNDAQILCDEEGNILTGVSQLTLDRISGIHKTEYIGPDGATGRHGYYFEGNWYFDYQVGSRFGLQTETANKNTTFRIDKREGVIHFGSEMGDKNFILEYVSDGMENGDDGNVVINKMFEQYCYAYVKWMLLDNMNGIPRWKRLEAKKQKRAAYLNARIRISDLKPGRMMQILMARGKWLK
jgi:hypothetical protein